MSSEAPRREGLRVRKLAGDPNHPDAVYHPDHITGLPSLRPFGGVSFIDGRGRNTSEPQQKIQVPVDYVTREPWIEAVGLEPLVVPAGTAANPYSKTPHVFMQADEIILHMLDGDYRYQVVHQPGKYEGAEHVDGAEHTATDVTGDPDTHVDWFYDADLIEEN